jgi:uncharacterized protein
MSTDIRLLSEEDLPALNAFLALHADSSMFLRGNLWRAGLHYEGNRLQAQYVGALRDDEIVGVVAHAWSGFVLVQAPEHLVDLVRFMSRLSGRGVSGISGPYAQVSLARTALGMASRSAHLDSREVLMALDLALLRVPNCVSNKEVAIRRATSDDLANLAQWRFEYEIEACGLPASEEARGVAMDKVRVAQVDGMVWLAVSGDEKLAMSMFNAAVPDCVQIGGVYTPLHLRNRGYARSVIAGSLLAAWDEGVQRAVLFTPNPSAMRCYVSLGFEQIGDFGLTLFD